MSQNPSPEVPQALQSFVDKHTFLSISDSKACFANSKGDGLPLICVDTPLCQALLTTNGGQLLSFTPKGGGELLWVSPNCNFSPGASLRGGIPLCLPWFGPHPADDTRPKHGIARTREWTLQSAQLDDSGVCHLKLALHHKADELFEHDFSAELTLSLGVTPTLHLTLTNTGHSDFDASWVMHTYFAINSLEASRVEGLDGREYADKVEGGKYFTQSGPVTFNGEVDRVYEDIQLPVTLDDGQHRYRIEGDQCPSVVVWNIGAEAGSGIADIGPDNHRGYVCVERGACLGDTWRLPAGQARSAHMTIKAA